MSHINDSEVIEFVDNLFISLMGATNYGKWQQLKCSMRFTSERSFISWLLELASQEASVEHEEAANISVNTKGDVADIKPSIEGEYVESNILKKHPCKKKATKSESTCKVADSQVEHEHSVESNADNYDAGEDDDSEKGVLVCYYPNGTSVNTTPNTSARLIAFDSKSVTKKHAQSSSNSSNPPLDVGIYGQDRSCKTCEICQKTYANRSTMVRHKKLVHYNIQPTPLPPEVKNIRLSGGGKVKTCNVCNKSFTFRSSMIRHRKQTHPNIGHADGTVQSQDSACESISSG